MLTIKAQNLDNILYLQEYIDTLEDYRRLLLKKCKNDVSACNLIEEMNYKELEASARRMRKKEVF